MILKISFLLLLAFFIMACGSRKNPYKNDMGIEPALMAQMDTVNYAEIKWLDSSINFGTIRATDTARMSFRFRNPGSKPLFVISVQPACGCTVTDYSKEPVWENKEGVIHAMYTWNGQTGMIRKTIGVRTNTRHGAWHTLSFYGEVVADSSRKN